MSAHLTEQSENRNRTKPTTGASTRRLFVFSRCPPSHATRDWGRRCPRSPTVALSGSRASGTDIRTLPYGSTGAHPLPSGWLTSIPGVSHFPPTLLTQWNETLRGCLSLRERISERLQEELRTGYTRVPVWGS